jgi:formylglycine-generating enzyme required for sulfatase activity
MNKAYTPPLYTPVPGEEPPEGLYYWCEHEVWNSLPADAAVRCVDFCDAFAYCAWAGKRLCGRVGGPSQSVFSDPNGFQSLGATAASVESEFVNACTQGGTTIYPYGNQYEEGKCIDAAWVAANGPNALSVSDAAERPCHGTTPPFDSIYDLSGSVREWQNLCTSNGIATSCYSAGGSAYEQDSELQGSVQSCVGYLGHTEPLTLSRQFGFRCCADAVLVPSTQ